MLTADGTEDPTKEEDETKEEYAASYVCFAPADDPEIILLVMADLPDKTIEYYGSKVAVPTARSILEEVLPAMHILPEYSEEELRELDVKIPLLEGSIDDAKATLTEIGMKYEVIGNGIEVVSQYPVTSTAMAKGGTVYLITEKGASLETTTVPAFEYLDLANANALAEQYGLNIAVSGASPSAVGATVNKQSIDYGSTVSKGTVIELEFKIPDVVFAD